MKKDLNEIAEIVDASGIRGQTAGVFFPENIFDLQQVIRAGKNITIRGGGSGLRAGAVPKGSLIVNISKLDKIHEIDVGGKTVYVDAGIILDDLNNYLAKYHLEFPIKPSSKHIATIGGMIATKASDLRTGKSGGIDSWINELEILDGKGNLIKIGKTDISDFVGMEGITGIVIKAKLRLSYVKNRTASFVKLDSFGRAIELARKLRLMQDVSMIELIDRLSSKFLGLEEGYYVIIEYDSSRGKLHEDDYVKLMKLKESYYKHLASEGFYYFEDFKLYLEKMPKIVDFLEMRGIPFFVNFGSGVIYPVFNEKQKNFLEDLYKLVRLSQGKVNGGFGVGVLKKKYVDDFDVKVLRSMKKRYDPDFKFNPNVLIDVVKEERAEFVDEEFDNLIGKVVGTNKFDDFDDEYRV